MVFSNRSGHLAVGEHAVVGLIDRIALQRLPGPVVVVGSVVEHEIEAQRNAVVAQFLAHLAQLLHGADRRVEFAVGTDGIAAVVVAFGALEQRHQVQVGDAHLRQIGDALVQALEIAGEQVDVAHRPDHALALEPLRVGRAGGVERLEVVGALQPGLGGGDEDVLQMEEEVVLVAVEFVQRGEQAGEIAVHPVGIGFPSRRVQALAEPGLKARHQALEGDGGLLVEPLAVVFAHRSGTPGGVSLSLGGLCVEPDDSSPCPKGNPGGGRVQPGQGVFSGS